MNGSSSIATLNQLTFESAESILLDQSTLPTLNYKLISGPFEKLKNTRLKMTNSLVMAQLNINSLRKKFNLLVEMQRNNVDIMLIFETETDFQFFTAQFPQKVIQFIGQIEMLTVESYSMSVRAYHQHY